MKRASELFMAVCFLAFLAAGLAGTALRERQTYSFYENRMLAAFPERSVQALRDGSFAAQLERYLADHAFGRGAVLKLKARVDLALGRPMVNDVVVTEDRLLPYLKPEQVVPAWVDQWADNMADNLKRISDTVAEYGGWYCYVAVPCQAAYYGEEYPWYLYNSGELYDLSSSGLARALAEREVAFLDVRAALAEQGSPEWYGSRVDNHYTMEGAFETYRLVMEKAAAESGLDFPILGPEDVVFETLPNGYLGSRERKLLELVSREEKLSILRPLEPVPFTRTDNGGARAAEVYQLPRDPWELLTYDLYMGGDIAQTVIDTGREELPSILVYGDSFTNAMECVTYLSFDKMYSLDLRHYHDMSLEDYIRAVQPDIVVCIRDYDVLLYAGENGGAAG